MNRIEDKELNILALGMMLTLASFSISLPNFGLGEVIDSLLLCFIIGCPPLILTETFLTNNNVLEKIFVELSPLMKTLISALLFSMSYFILDYLINIDMKLLNLIHLRPFAVDSSLAFFALFFTVSQILVYRMRKAQMVKISMTFQLFSIPLYIGIVQASNSLGGHL